MRRTLCLAYLKGGPTVFCPTCGNAARPNAKFCDGCGQPLAAAQEMTALSPARLRTEYTQVFLDWRANGVPYDTVKKPPDSRSEERSMAAPQQRVISELDPMLQQGWSMDGPFDSAVNWEKTSHTHFFQTAWYGRYTGAHVKLRRLTK
jgi:hypothetical protein